MSVGRSFGKETDRNMLLGRMANAKGCGDRKEAQEAIEAASRWLEDNQNDATVKRARDQLQEAYPPEALDSEEGNPT